MRNILFISPSTKVKGGISSLIRNYLQSNLSKQHNILIVASHVDGSKLQKLLQAIIGIIKTFFYLIFKPIDIVHIHAGDIISFKRKYYYITLAKLFRKKIIYHHHGAFFMDHYVKTSQKWKKRIKKTFEQVDIVICLSESWRKNILEIAPNANTCIIYNAVKIPSFDNNKKKEKEYVMLTFLGQVGYRKGIFDLLKVIKKLIDEGFNIKLKVGGNGDINLFYQKLHNLNLNSSVEYLGWVSGEEKDLLLRNTDIFILPSYAEGMPMSILEAMSYGIPVISTYVGGIPEIVHDGETGLLVQPADIESLYRKTKNLILNREYRERLGEAGREHIVKKYNLEKTVEELNRIYNTL